MASITVKSFAQDVPLYDHFSISPPLPESNSVASKVVVPGYDESIAVGDEFLGGAIIYAHFSQFELELSLSGYTDIEVLKTDAAQFLQVYESKIGKK